MCSETASAGKLSGLHLMQSMYIALKQIDANMHAEIDLQRDYTVALARRGQR